MNPEEVIELLSLQREDCTKSVLREDDIDFVIEAVEKQVAIKPKILAIGYDYPTGCSLCDDEVSVYNYNYCKNCGQKLDWGNED